MSYISPEQAHEYIGQVRIWMLGNVKPKPTKVTCIEVKGRVFVNAGGTHVELDMVYCEFHGYKGAIERVWFPPVKWERMPFAAKEQPQ